MTSSSLEETDTVIIGGGPSSLLLSYILHGFIPHYTGGHQDCLLDSKLKTLPNLLRITSDTYSHFGDSLRYSQQALPVNALLDTLVRPNADVEIDPPSCIEWRYEPSNAVAHIVLTSASAPGGQWEQLSGRARDEIGALSYSEMLSLPGYSFREHYIQKYKTGPSDLMRPSRALVASYYAMYPEAVGLSQSIRVNSNVTQVSRTQSGFLIQPQNIKCRNLVLATGVFTQEIALPGFLPTPQRCHDSQQPLLVIGSGFSAADAIIAAPPHQKILHVYKWNPAGRASPLKGCHQQAYPEYAGVYRLMKAAASQLETGERIFPLSHRRRNPFFTQRDWTLVYEGLPNVQIQQMKKIPEGFLVTMQDVSGKMAHHTIGGVAYHIGRRGSLAYLSRDILREILPSHEDGVSISRSLRSRVESNAEIAPHIFAIGSLTGDSLVRHAFGVCVVAASHIIARRAKAGTCDGPESCATYSRALESKGCLSKDESSFTTPPYPRDSRNEEHMKAHQDNDLKNDNTHPIGSQCLRDCGIMATGN